MGSSLAGSPIFEKRMSRLRKDKKIVEQCNLLLAQELGRNPHGQPVYVWRYSEDWTRTKRVMSLLNGDLVPEFDYKADTESGILRAVPKYVEEKVCLHLTNQWIMSIWLPSEDFDQWRAKYGDALEWPKHGDHWPVSHPKGVVCLEPGVVPTTDITWEFIYQAKRDRGMTLADYEKAYDERQHSKEQDMDERLMGTLTDNLPTYFGIPGSRSFPNWLVGTTKVDERISDPKSIFEG